ncbi:MAG: GAF domain-containing sensor histidine kinase [Desulfosoma sp.]
MGPISFQTDLTTVSFSRRKLMHRNRALSVLLGLSEVLSQSKGLNELLTQALDYVLEHTAFDAGRVYLMEPDRQSLRLAAFRGMDVQGLERVNLEEGFTGRAAKSCAFIAQSVDALGDAKRAELLLSKGIHTVVCVPFVVLDRVEGVMNLAAKSPMQLHQDEVDLLMMIGHLIGVAAIHAETEEILREIVEELQQRNETIQLFVSTVGHDLKGPAVAAYGFAKRLHERYAKLLDERGMLYCEQILKATRQIACMVDELNNFLRTREMAVRLQPLPVASLWDSLRQEFASELAKKSVHWSEHSRVTEVTADEVLVLRALRNLVQNALSHAGPGLRSLQVGCEEREGFYVFWVADDGEGIPFEHQRKLFEPFARLKPSKGVEGSGLGLAIVREVAHRHGGEAWVRSEPGKGAVFFFSLAKVAEMACGCVPPHNHAAEAPRHDTKDIS